MRVQVPHVQSKFMAGCLSGSKNIKKREHLEILNATFDGSCSKIKVSLTTRCLKTVPFTPFTPGALQYTVGYCSHFDIMLGPFLKAIHAKPHDDFVR